MNKYLIIAAALSLGFTACEDVPAPYQINAGTQGTTEETVKELPYSESFSTTLGGFKSVLLSGAGAWTINYSCATATGYDNGTKITTVGSYILVSPEIALGSNPVHVSYNYILRFDKGQENQQCLITNNYTGDPTTTVWTVLKKDHTEGKDYVTFYDADIAVPDSLLGDTVRVAFYYNTPSSGSTWEVKNFSIAEGTGAAAEGSAYTPKGASGSSEGVPGAPAGDGTAASPYNVARSLSIINAGTASTEKVYIKGIVASISNIDTSYGNANYFLTDGGTTTAQLEVYRGYGFNGEKFTSTDAIKVGDTLVIQGVLTLYGGSKPQVTTGSSIVSINGETSGTGGGGSGTETPGAETGSSVTFDFAVNNFNIPTEKTKNGTYTYGDYSITLDAPDAFYFNSTSSYVILGKKGASLTFSAFDFAVSKIEVVGREGASGNVLQNIYVGDVAVSTETKGATASNTYEISPDYQAAGNQYVLRVSSAHNTQITKIVIYKADGTAGGGSTTEPTEPATTEPVAALSIDFTKGQGDWTIKDVNISTLTYVWANDTKYGMKATAYVSGTRHETESWIVSPAVTVTEGTLVFNEAANYFTDAAGLAKYTDVLVSTDDGASWNSLTVTRATTGASWTFADSNADLSAYKGRTIRLGFKYTSDTEVAGTWEIKTVEIK